MTFYYHMYGFDMGMLVVSVNSTAGSSRTVWIKSGNQGLKWHEAQVYISERGGYQASQSLFIVASRLAINLFGLVIGGQTVKDLGQFAYEFDQSQCKLTSQTRK